jgi:iron complex outermembrane receptor protein
MQNSTSSVSVIQRKDLDKSDGVILTSVLNKFPVCICNKVLWTPVESSDSGHVWNPENKTYFEGIR